MAGDELFPAMVRFALDLSCGTLEAPDGVGGGNHYNQDFPDAFHPHRSSILLSASLDCQSS